MNKKSKNIQNIQRRFGPTYLALKNKTTVFILTVLLALFGIASYKIMPRELYPEIVVPNIIITTVYPGNSPVDIENFITRPLEKEFKGLKGMKKMNSSSYQDVSSILLEFETDVEVKQALQDVKDKVDKAKSELPNDLENDPVVEDLDFAEFPIMNVNISGEYSLAELKKYAEVLKDEFEGLSEISEADIKGIEEREIQINLDPHKMEANGIAFQDVADAINFENITMGAGELIADQIRRTIRTEADYTNMEQIENTIVKMNNGKAVYVRDIAKVLDGFKDQNSISRMDNKPVVSLSIVKKSGANVLDASDKVKAVIEQQKERRNIPRGLTITITDDGSHYVRNQISNLENSIIMGMILVIFVLYLFLGLRNALFAGLAIPMSMFISFILVKQMGYSLNMMILYSLILALGMLVDNAIVVVENIYRLHGLGYSKMQATKKGVSEIAFPIIASTLTTIAVFFPLLLWDGMMGEFMKYLPITLIIVLSSSLFVALILNPAFTSSFVKIEDITASQNKKRVWKRSGIIMAIAAIFYAGQIWVIGNLFATVALIMILNMYLFRPMARWFQTKFLVRLENGYEKTLYRALKGKRPLGYFFGTLVLLVVSIVYFNMRGVKTLYFPDVDPQSIYVTMELPLGTDIERTNMESRKMEAIVNEVIEPHLRAVKSITTNVGNGKGGFFESSRSPNKSLTTISFKEFRERDDVNTSAIMKELTEKLDGFVGAKIYVEKQDDGPPTGAPVSIDVIGDDFGRIIAIVDDFTTMIEADNIQGIDELKMNINVNQPQMLINVDREKARLFELSTQKIAFTLRNSLYGYDVGNFKDGEDEYDIFLRLDHEYRNDVSTLMNQRVFVNGHKIPISSVADFTYATTYDKINRKDNRRVITLSSNVTEGYNANEINARIGQVLDNYEMPQGYEYKFSGEQQDQAEDMSFLMQALFVALALIVIILVTQFNSFIRPFIIMLTVLFSTIGVFIGLATFKMDFIVIMTMIGIISLAGIVVNNGIVLVDYIDLLRKRKREELGLKINEFLPVKHQLLCLVQAGKTRLRPVLLTAITTVLGLLPLAVGFNFDFFGLYTRFDPDFYIGGEMVAFWAPMSWTVIFGLTFSTILTLIIIPVMYMITIKVNYKLRTTFGWSPKREEVETEDDE